MDIVDRKIDDTRKLLVQQYGFAAGPDLLLWRNVEVQLARMNVQEVESRPRNMACHDLLQRLKLPTGTKELLSLNLNFCVKPASTSEMTKITFKRLKSDLRQMWALKDAINDGNYIPNLYLKSKYIFREAPKHIKIAIKKTTQAILQIQDQLR